jgi:hypothetical protein
MKFNSEQGVRYFRADVPDDHIKDALSMHHEKTLGDQVATPEDLYEKMKSVPPTVTKVIDDFDRAKGIYRVINEDIDAVPAMGVVRPLHAHGPHIAAQAREQAE